MYDVTRPNQQPGPGREQVPGARGAAGGAAKKRAAPRSDGPDDEKAVTRQVGDKVTRKIEKVAAQQERAIARTQQRMAQLERHSQRHEQAMARMAETVDKLDRLTAHLEALELWTRDDVPSRKPRFSREDIAREAIRIADDEGFEALSMRNLATALGAGTMTLYHYVKTKDELLALVSDEVMGEVVMPPGELVPDDWREALTTLAHRSLDAIIRHPWMLDMPDVIQIGPNSVRHFDETLQAVASTGLPIADQLEVSSAVDHYVFGFCLSSRQDLPADKQVVDDGMLDYVVSLMETGNYPALQARADELGAETMWSIVHEVVADPGRFDRGLQMLLDGLELRIERAGVNPASSGRPPRPSARPARGPDD